MKNEEIYPNPYPNPNPNPNPNPDPNPYLFTLCWLDQSFISPAGCLSSHYVGLVGHANRSTDNGD